MTWTGTQVHILFGILSQLDQTGLFYERVGAHSRVSDLDLYLGVVS